MKDQIINRFDKLFGPAGSSAGWIFMLSGIYILSFSFSGIFFFLIGAFLAFTYTSVVIDKTDRKVKLTNNFFGILRFGRWTEVNPDMTVTVKPNTIVYRTYSRSNRAIENKTHNYRVLLFDENKNCLMPLKYESTLGHAIESAKELSVVLGLNSVL
ncbi:MAG: hypothetical protein JXB34_05010 [Bacteroidales bacterium]|nr:hypothetical protein [Bacteroidales bacterium]